MKSHHVKITVPGGFTGTAISLDGIAVDGVFNVEFRHQVNSPPVLTLQVFALQGVEIEGEMITERIVLCPDCKVKQLAAIETSAHPAEWKTYERNK